MKKNRNEFDCLKEKERIHTAMLKEMSGSSLSEERAFYNQKITDKKLASWVAKVKQRSTTKGKLLKIG